MTLCLNNAPTPAALPYMELLYGASPNCSAISSVDPIPFHGCRGHLPCGPVQSGVPLSYWAGVHWGIINTFEKKFIVSTDLAFWPVRTNS